jgi:hypothetical protein
MLAPIEMRAASWSILLIVASAHALPASGQEPNGINRQARCVALEASVDQPATPMATTSAVPISTTWRSTSACLPNVVSVSVPLWRIWRLGHAR